MAGRTLLQMDQTTPANQALLWYFTQRSQNPNLDRHCGLSPDRYCQKADAIGLLPLHNPTDTLHLAFR